MKKMTLILILVCMGLVTLLAACSSGPPGLKACNYFWDEYLGKALYDVGRMETPSLSLVRDEAEKLNDLAQDAEPEIRAAAAALLQSVMRLDDPFGDVQGDAQESVIRACRATDNWPERPPPN